MNEELEKSTDEIKPRPFGQYFILEKIAQGGMAEIFKGLTHDFTGLKKHVVIKRILPHIAANKSFIDMLVDEAKIAVSLTHGNIAQTYDLGKVGRDYFIVMEYVDGRTLSQMIKRCQKMGQQIPIPVAVHIIAEICSGLEYIHRRKDENGEALGIVHRDISPQNIIVAFSGIVKIVDFGVAKAVDRSSSKSNSKPNSESSSKSNSDVGMLKGKFAYMSPEQTRADSIDYRSDIFSAAILLWEMLAIKRLFKKKSNAQTVEAVQEQEYVSVAEFRKDVPKELENIIAKALEKDPNKRFSSAEEMGITLTKFLLKNFPDYKNNQLAEFLEKITDGEDDETVAFQEPTYVEKKKRKEKDLNQSDDDTVLVDTHALDFKSIFDEIDIEDTEETTQALSREELFSERSDNSKKISAQEIDSEIGSIAHVSEKKKAGNRKIFIGILLVAMIILYSFFFTREKGSSVGEISIDIQSDPQNVSIFINDEKTQWKTPAKFKINSGKFPLTIQLKTQAYQVWSTQISETDKTTFSYQIKLKKVQLQSIHVVSQPSQAELYVDGIFVGNTPFELKNLNSDQEYELLVRKKGYTLEEKQIKVKDLTKSKVDIVLSKERE